MAFEKALDLILEGVFNIPLQGDDFFFISNIPNHSLSISKTYDGDVFLVPIIKQDRSEKIKVNDFGNIINHTEILHFSLTEHSPSYHKCLYVLAEAIRRDNLPRNNNNLEFYDASVVLETFKWMQHNAYHFNSLTDASYERLHDDHDGDTSMTLCVNIHKDEIKVHINSFNGLRFRTHCGGGKSLRVRNALLFLAYISSK